MTFGWITSNATIIFMSMMMRYGRENGFIVAVLFPGVGRFCWSLAISFMILATTTQFGNGKLEVYGHCKTSHLNFTRILFIFSQAQLHSFGIWRFSHRWVKFLSPHTFWILWSSCLQPFHLKRHFTKISGWLLSFHLDFTSPRTLLR